MLNKLRDRLMKAREKHTNQKLAKSINRVLTLFILSVLTVNISLSQGNKTQLLYLSGTDNNNTETWDFFCTSGRNSGYWSTIEVPSHWEQQGFGDYDYGRDYMTNGKKYKFTDEQGLYKYKFSVPEDWQGRKVNIVFEGSMTDTEVKINGVSAGEKHLGSFYRFKYDISELLEFGKENLLEVTVSKWSSNKSVNAAERRADYWIFGGIFRPVYLESMPGDHIDYVAIDAKADGSFKAEVHLINNSGKKKIKATIKDSKGNVVTSIEDAVGKKDDILILSKELDDIKTWSQELPELYSVDVLLIDSENIIHQISEKFGFRTVEIREGDGIYVNGAKVKMKGINRHAFWPETGRCLNDEINLLDVKLMKEMNMNAVRCAHYPPDKVFLEYCDSLGLFVINELAGWQNAYDTESGEKLVKELVLRDVNHPSIIFWSNGNEGGHNKELDDDYGMYDPSNRPVIHAHHKPGNDYNGIDCNHYEKYYSCKNLLEGPNIYMPTEFLHGQDDGGMAAGLYDFWELFWESDLSGGGFLWTLVDEGIVRTDMNGYIDVNRVNAPDGVVGPHREKEGSFFAMREIFSPIKIDIESLPNNFAGEIPVENRYHFTNLNQCSFKYQFVNFEHPALRTDGHQVMKEGDIVSPDIAPVSKGAINVDLPEDWNTYDALIVKAFNPIGDEILTWDWAIKNNEDYVQKLVKWEKGDVEVTENDETIDLKGEDVTIKINKENGTLSGLKNEYSLPLSFSDGPLLVGKGESTFKEIKHFKSEDGYTVESLYEGALKYIKWTMNSTGWVKLEYEYNLEGKQDFCGVTFNYPESKIIGVKWLGNGPYRVWKNRMQGGNTDVYQAMYNNTFTGSSPWIYPEFKGYYSDIKWMEFSTVQGKFLVVPEEEGLFARLFEFYSISGPENLPELPGGDISFLDGIPPTGTKLWTNIYKKTEQLGPNSEKNTMNGPIKRTLYFYFGLTEK